MSEPSSHGISPVNLKANCEKCYGLCCVALPFSASADFAYSKEAGRPCRNLLDDFRCGIHDVLRPSGFAGCTVYDCFGAGQQVSQEIYPGRDWRTGAVTAKEMFAVFLIVRQLHELLWYLEEALTLASAESLRRPLNAAHDAITVLVSASAAELLAFDVARQRSSVAALLVQTSSIVRTAVAGDRPRQRRVQHAGADLLGAKLARSDLRAVDFRGTNLIGADLRGADLRMADVLGADLRAADVSGANLSTTLFLTQFQLNSARGDGSTSFPAKLTKPGHWTSQSRRSDRGGSEVPE